MGVSLQSNSVHTLHGYGITDCTCIMIYSKLLLQYRVALYTYDHVAVLGSDAV
jgi:hypothetical protein